MDTLLLPRPGEGDPLAIGSMGPSRWVLDSCGKLKKLKRYNQRKNRKRTGRNIVRMGLFIKSSGCLSQGIITFNNLIPHNHLGQG